MENKSSFNIDCNAELSKNLIVHTNVEQEAIFITTDKIRLILADAITAIKAMRDWITPVSLLVSFIATLASTAEFKNLFGISKEIWAAGFYLFTVLCFIWLCKSLLGCWKNRTKADISKIIERMQANKSNKNITYNSYEVQGKE
jgi:hypothetical protein